MSYFDLPRLHFKGRFQADTSTVNNDVRHYKDDAFQPEFQAMMVGQGQGSPQRTNGYWNPEGSGAWRILHCQVTAAVLPTKTIRDPRVDPVVGLRIAGSSDRVAGKLVDLDPQQQFTSQIWGLRIALEDLLGTRWLDGAYDVAPFFNLWKRQQVPANFDQTLGAAFQSQVSQIAWGDVSRSETLTALKAACDGGPVSICFNTFGFDRDPTAPDYTTGVLTGTIGPARPHEPKHFVLGRQLIAAYSTDNPFVPTHQVYSFTCVDHHDTKVLTADFGNCLPIVHADGTLYDVGRIYLAVSKHDGIKPGQSVSESDVAIIGEIPYKTPDWYRFTAGVVDLPYGHDAWLQQNIGSRPVLLVQAARSNGYDVLVCEADDGAYVRADNQVQRLNPGDVAEVKLYGTRFGKPAALQLQLAPNDTLIGGAGTGAVLNAERWPVPDVGAPAAALTYAPTLELGSDGRGKLQLTAAKTGPGCPRGYLDGQVYGVGYSVQGVSADAPQNPWNFVSCLLWDAWPIPADPTWYRDIRPILAQYGNLYPIMSRHLVDLNDYDSVVQHRESLIFCFELPESDPNSMPVSRDLSANKRAGILRWLRAVDAQGKPKKGDPADAPVATPNPRHTVKGVTAIKPSTAAPAYPPELGGRLDYLTQVLAKNATQRADGGGEA